MAATKEQDLLEIPYHMAQLLARTAAMTALVKQGHRLKDICEMLDNNPQLIDDALAQILEEQRKTH